MNPLQTCLVFSLVEHVSRLYNVVLHHTTTFVKHKYACLVLLIHSVLMVPTVKTVHDRLSWLTWQFCRSVVICSGWPPLGTPVVICCHVFAMFVCHTIVSAMYGRVTDCHRVTVRLTLLTRTTTTVTRRHLQAVSRNYCIPQKP